MTALDEAWSAFGRALDERGAFIDWATFGRILLDHRPRIEAEAVRSEREHLAKEPLDEERLWEAFVKVEAGYILTPDRLTRTYWRKVAAAYASLGPDPDEP